jgi:hypothetical protein
MISEEEIIEIEIETRGGTQKAFKSLDESPGSNEPGFLVRDLWYS